MDLLDHSSQFPPAADQTRANERAQLVIACEVRQGSRPWQLVHLEDLSPRGFRIVGLGQASSAKPLSIRIPGMQLLSAYVRWNRGNEVGCEFASPLHVAVFDHIVRNAR